MRSSPFTGGTPRRFGFCVAVGLALVVLAARNVRGGSEEPMARAAATPTVASGRGSGPSPRRDAKVGNEAQTRARRLFQDAEAHFQAGLFAEALGEYQAGYDAAALPGFLINIAQCQRRLGNLTGALTTYRKFIMVAPDSPYVPQVRSLVTDLEKLARDAERERDRERAASTKVTANPPTESKAPTLIERPGALASAPEAQKESGGRASSTRWWWIGGAGALIAIAGGTAAVFALRSGDSTTLHEGSLGSLRR